MLLTNWGFYGTCLGPSTTAESLGSLTSDNPSSSYGFQKNQMTPCSLVDLSAYLLAWPASWL